MALKKSKVRKKKAFNTESKGRLIYTGFISGWKREKSPPTRWHNDTNY